MVPSAGALLLLRGALSKLTVNHEQEPACSHVVCIRRSQLEISTADAELKALLRGARDEIVRVTQVQSHRLGASSEDLQLGESVQSKHQVVPLSGGSTRGVVRLSLLVLQLSVKVDVSTEGGVWPQIGVHAPTALPDRSVKEVK